MDSLTRIQNKNTILILLQLLHVPNKWMSAHFYQNDGKALICLHDNQLYYI